MDSGSQIYSNFFGPKSRFLMPKTSQNIPGTILNNFGKNDFRIHTVEHVLAAVFGLQIDNLLIELTAKEPPVMDGSAIPFVEVLLQIGIQTQEAIRYELVID